MEDFDSLIPKTANYFFALLMLINLLSVVPLTAAALYEDERLMHAAGVDQSIFHPRSLRIHSSSSGPSVEFIWVCYSQLAHGDASGDDSHEVPAVDHLCLRALMPNSAFRI
jgi:hypothetical protein